MYNGDSILSTNLGFVEVRISFCFYKLDMEWYVYMYATLEIRHLLQILNLLKFESFFVLSENSW